MARSQPQSSSCVFVLAFAIFRTERHSRLLGRHRRNISEVRTSRRAKTGRAALQLGEWRLEESITQPCSVDGARGCDRKLEKTDDEVTKDDVALPRLRLRRQDHEGGVSLAFLDHLALLPYETFSGVKIHVLPLSGPHVAAQNLQFPRSRPTKTQLACF